MIVDRIKFSKEFFVLGAGEWVTMEAQLQENEDPCEAIKELKQKMISMYGGYYSNGSSVANYTSLDGWPKEQQKVINRAYERMEVLIGNCTSLEQLAEHKEFVNKNPDLMSAYMDKAKSLTEKIKA